MVDGRNSPKISVAQAQPLYMSIGGRKVRLIDTPIPIRSSDCIGRYNRWISSSDFGIGRLCRSILSSDSFIDRSCFLGLSSDFCIGRLCRPVWCKKSVYRYFETYFVSGHASPKCYYLDCSSLPLQSQPPPHPHTWLSVYCICIQPITNICSEYVRVCVKVPFGRFGKVTLGYRII
jgi:hypothetical protein